MGKSKTGNRSEYWQQAEQQQREQQQQEQEQGRTPRFTNRNEPPRRHSRYFAPSIASRLTTGPPARPVPFYVTRACPGSRAYSNSSGNSSSSSSSSSRSSDSSTEYFTPDASPRQLQYEIPGLGQRLQPQGPFRMSHPPRPTQYGNSLQPPLDHSRSTALPPPSQRLTTPQRPPTSRVPSPPLPRARFDPALFPLYSGYTQPLAGFGPWNTSEPNTSNPLHRAHCHLLTPAEASKALPVARADLAAIRHEFSIAAPSWAYAVLRRREAEAVTWIEILLGILYRNEVEVREERERRREEERIEREWEGQRWRFCGDAEREGWERVRWDKARQEKKEREEEKERVLERDKEERREETEREAERKREERARARERERERRDEEPRSVDARREGVWR